MDLLNNGYYNSQAVQVLNAVEYDEFDNPIGLYESPSDPSSCNFTVSDNSRCKFVDSNCFQQQVSTCYMTVTGLLATDTVTVFGSSAVPTLSAGRIDFVVGSKYYGISIFKSGVLWAYYPMCESIINPAVHIYHDCSGNEHHATLINGTVGNEGKQNEFHYLQKGFNHYTLTNGTSHFLNTGIIPTINTKVTVWGRVTKIINTEHMIGGSQGALYRTLFGILSGKWWSEFGAAGTSANIVADTNYHRFEFDRNYFKVDGVIATTFTVSNSDTSAPLYIFARSASAYGMNFTGMECDRVLIEESGAVIRDFISKGTYFLEVVDNIVYYSGFAKTIPFDTYKIPTGNTPAKDIYLRMLEFQQDTKSFLPSGCYLQQYSTNTNLKLADNTVGLWYGPEGDPYKVSYNTLCLQDPWNEQVFIGNKTKDFKLGPISTHYNNLTPVQKRTERVVRNVVDDALIEDPAFSHDVTVAAGDLTYSLYNIGGYTMNGIIDWGDGNTQTINTTATQTITKTYSVAGTYTVRFTGTMEYCNPYYLSTTINPYKVVKINNWGNVGFKHLSFANCKITNIPNSPITGLNQTALRLPSLFVNCTLLTGTIPDNLLMYAKACTSLYNVFYLCTSLTGQIPENLFRYCPNLTDCRGALYSCTGLTGQIPENLFKYNPLLRYVAYGNFYQSCFAECQNLSGSIPENLFRYNPLLKSFSGLFYNCKNLTGSIPSNLFRYNTLATEFSATFSNCINLTGNIPEDLFRYNTEALIFGYQLDVLSYYGCFYNCNKLTGSIPANLFKYNINATVFGSVFARCVGLTGSIPAGLFDTNVAAVYMNQIFYNCPGLTLIPSDLFRYNNTVTTFSGIFNNCTSITSIPTGLFDYNPNVTTFAYTFGNTRITTIPSNLFTNNTKVTSFNFTFATNPALSAIPSNLFDTNTLVTTFDNVFNGCTGITSIPTDLFRFNVNVTNMSSVFYNTRITAIPIDIFRYNTLVTTFSSCFRQIGTSNTLNIPADVFRYNVAVTNMSYVFSATLCSFDNTLFQYNTAVTNMSYVFQLSRISTIPSGLFDNNINVTDFTAAFNENNISVIPTDLFKYNTKVLDFTAVFNSCPLIGIPSGLFDTNVLVICFRQAFGSNTIAFPIPEDLFYFNGNVVSYSYVFNNTRNLVLPTRLFNIANLGKVTTWQNFLNVTSTAYSPTGTIQKIWDVSEGGDVTYTVQPTKTNAFNSCTALSNYAEIPAAWT